MDIYATTFNSSYFDQLAVQSRVRKELFQGMPRLAWFLTGLLLWLAGGAITAILAGVLNQHYLPTLPSFAVWVILMLLVGLAIARVFPLGARRRAEWLDAMYSESISFRADSKGAAWSGKGWNYWVDWSICTKMLHVDDVIVLVFGDRGMLLPRRAFENDQAARSFVGFALEQMSPAARAATMRDRSMQRLLPDSINGD